MSRSFGIVDEKVFEADFFLMNLKESGANVFKMRCYFNAFLAAARSITFCMQASLNDAKGFSEWYAVKQAVLKDIPEARFFNRARTESQKTGWAPITAGYAFRDKKGRSIVNHYFMGNLGEGPIKDAPIKDVFSSCKTHLGRLIEIVFDCYVEFGYLMDPDQYYSIEGLKKRNCSIEDLERDLGIPTGWTNLAPGSNSYTKERLNVLRRSVSGTEIDVLFKKYLGKTRKSFLRKKLK